MKLLFVMVVLTLGIIDAGLGNEICENWTDCSEPCDGGTRSCTRSNGKHWYFDCHRHDCSEIEDCGQADLVFVLDDSTNIGERDHWIMKQFAIDVTKGVNIAPEFWRIGMVTFADDATTHWRLNGIMTEDELKDSIWGLPKIGGNTNTAEGLKHAQQIIEETARDSVKHIVVIITQSDNSLNKHHTIPQANEMHATGIEIFAIGIGGKINKDELRGIASEHTDFHTHHVIDYTALTDITTTVITEICAAANKTECDEMWSPWAPCVVNDGGCGDGVHSRTRECRFYNYDGADPIRRNDTQHLECEVPCNPYGQPLGSTTTTRATNEGSDEDQD